PAAVAVADHRLEPAAGRPAPRPDGGAGSADRAGFRGRGVARLQGRTAGRSLGRRPAAAAPHGGRPRCAPGPRAADAAARPALLPARPDYRPNDVPDGIHHILPRAASRGTGLGGGLAVLSGAVHAPVPRPEPDRECPDLPLAGFERRSASI